MDGFMKIDFATSLLDLDGQPLQDGEEAVTLRKIAVNALLATLIVDGHTPENLSGEAKIRNALLAEAIHTAKSAIDLKAEDVVLLKERVGRAYQPLLVMRAWALLDPPA
jgi:hypothetical protein